MLIDINNKTIGNIKNRDLRAYAAIYLDIYDDYLQQVEKTGIQIASPYDGEEMNQRKTRLIAKGAISRNNNKSMVLNRISPACEACQKGIGSITFFISLLCRRKCYFCFNPNQENYEYYLRNKRDCIEELSNIHYRNIPVQHLALTGGEPLLHPQETLDFFKKAKELYPSVYTRLYTCGDGLNANLLKELNKVRLDEIRFSIKQEDSPDRTGKLLELLKQSQDYIPNVMVEMPVIPGSKKYMEELLVVLDNLRIYGINLLEFCFPFNNVLEYKKRGFKIKNPPFKVLYNYWYGGGLPVDGSEGECLDLLDFALKEKLKLGIHYCSLENKHTAQIFQQNCITNLPGHLFFSERDYFLKSAKVFGQDRKKVLKIFNSLGFKDYLLNDEYNYVEFAVEKIKYFKDLNLEIAISTGIMEEREDGRYYRELKVDLAYSGDFDLNSL
ncbi:MAG: radical SAM protein [Clostridia bacterium]|nr:radical SAM protein [Clostridia bacterium]